jgi:regulator-associated protein of mTOR
MVTWMIWFTVDLQVLLSHSHRFRALVLLGRFLDMGAWAVDLALSVGIFPYVLKLLQTTATDLRQILVFIWTKILALDKVKTAWF